MLSARLLSLPPFVWIGLISYSAYLWHQPVFAFARLRSLDPPGSGEYLFLIALSLGLAWLSWRFVEAPWRRRAFSARTVFTAAPVVAALLIAFGLSGVATGGFPSRLPANVTAMLRQAERGPHWEECNERVADPCILGADTAPSFALWGDSHAHALSVGLGPLAKTDGVSFALFVHPACPSLVGVYRVGAQGNCNRFNRKVMAQLAREPALKTVILSSRYAVNLYGGTVDFGPAEADRRSLPLISSTPDKRLSRAAAERLFAQSYAKTVEDLLALGRNVVLVEPVPEVGYDVPQVLAHKLLHGQGGTPFTRPYAYYAKRQKVILGVIRSVARAHGLTVISPEKRLCDGPRCITEIDGKPLYFDDDHLSAFGSATIAALFKGPLARIADGK